VGHAACINNTRTKSEGSVVPAKPKRACKFAKCPGTTQASHGLCELHKHTAFDRLRNSADKAALAEKGKFYSSSAWQQLRRTFLAVYPNCNACGEKATVADHILPRRSHSELALDSSNLQPLCASCHSRKTGLEIASRRKAKKDEDKDIY
jgi:5-methylcytosine-specific restriction enzyme A